MAKNLSSLGNLLEGALSRHGIGIQVVSAQIVSRANDLLHELLPEHARADVRTESYRTNELVIACKNAPARYATEKIEEHLTRRLEEHFPRLTLKSVVYRLKPHVFEDGWYNSQTV